jgi:hypothetical protein
MIQKPKEGSGKLLCPPDLVQDLSAWREISANTNPDALVFPRGTYLSRDNFLRRFIRKRFPSAVHRRNRGRVSGFMA